MLRPDGFRHGYRQQRYIISSSFDQLIFFRSSASSCTTNETPACQSQSPRTSQPYRPLHVLERTMPFRLGCADKGVFSSILFPSPPPYLFLLSRGRTILDTFERQSRVNAVDPPNMASEIPECTRSCLQDAVNRVGCRDLEDTACYCTPKNQQAMNSDSTAVSCILGACPSEELSSMLSTAYVPDSSPHSQSRIVTVDANACLYRS